MVLAKNEDSGSFKEFVSIKRELALLQEEHSKLKDRLHNSSTQKPPTPTSKSALKARIGLKLRQ